MLVTSALPATRCTALAVSTSDLLVVMLDTNKICDSELLQAVKEEGVYAQGFVTIQPFPVEIHGPEAHRTLPMRRVERLVGDDEGAELMENELQKVWLFNARQLRDAGRAVSWLCGVPSLCWPHLLQPTVPGWAHFQNECKGG